DLLSGRVLALEGKRRCPCSHVQPGNFLQNSHQFLADAIGKIFAALVITEIGERERGHGLSSNWRAGCWRRSRFGLKKIEGEQTSGDHRDGNNEHGKFPRTPCWQFRSHVRRNVLRAL